ncbi:MAG: glycosyltransferase family 2 protein [Lentisphaerae bacterium]|jgi:glycosyltransferase involved in cell wall biosynthesis|nr:glycosyltransferase family 2 protein [Victivallaceae bacterium]MDD3702801.1 glycosyltransferase family 2 protein [Victivallaceae bacterium]NLK83471.1 glycosyltransferase family 2 protein [Lentisphaerota bacterium]
MVQTQKVFIVIPSYKPGDELIGLVEILLAYGRDAYRVIVVDDGSGIKYRIIFEHLARNLKVTVLTHNHNKGKGAALKTAFNYLLERSNIMPVITADADGQHVPEDIVRVLESAVVCPESIVLGCRSMTGKKIPIFSRIGNNWSVRIFKALTGEEISDIQTGLRGIPASYLPLLIRFPQDGFDFESAMLLDNAIQKRYPVKEIEITTIYSRKHKSHFRPLQDSWRILRSLKAKNF